MSKLPAFRDEKLLRRALTHSSYVEEHPEARENNERLEFLGDAVLNFLSGEFLYNRYPQMSEGELTRRRSALVEEKQLAKFATDLGIGKLMRLGRGAAAKDKGRHNLSLLSDAFEAIIGAYFLDSGIDAVRAFVEPLFISVADSIPSSKPSADPKSLFQQWAQAHTGKTPQYLIVEQSGPEHARKFTAEVRVAGKSYGRGTERSKQAAEKLAAEAALKKVRQPTDRPTLRP